MVTRVQDGFTVTATAREVLPGFGVAFVVDDNETIWGITRNADGPGLDTLQAGARVQLMLQQHGTFSLVRAYRPLS